MKTASNVFLIIGIICDLVAVVSGGFMASIPEERVAGIVMLSLGLIGILSSSICLLSVKKRVGFGILSLLFSSLLGGIFYLVWDGK